MPKLLSFLLILLLFGCRGEGAPEKGGLASRQSLEELELPELTQPNTMARETLSKWPEYNALQSAIYALKEAKDRQELGIVIDNILEKLQLLEASEFPSSFDSPRVRSRMKVMRTYVLKAKAEMSYEQSAEASVSELWKAYSNLNRQFNVMVNNTLDTQLLLEDE